MKQFPKFHAVEVGEKMATIKVRKERCNRALNIGVAEYNTDNNEFVVWRKVMYREVKQSKGK